MEWLFAGSREISAVRTRVQPHAATFQAVINHLFFCQQQNLQRGIVSLHYISSTFIVLPERIMTRIGVQYRYPPEVRPSVVH